MVPEIIENINIPWTTLNNSSNSCQLFPKKLGFQTLSEHLTILNEPRILNKKFDYLGATGPPRGGQKSRGGKGAGAAIGQGDADEGRVGKLQHAGM